MTLTPDGRDPASGIIIDYPAYHRAWRARNKGRTRTPEQIEAERARKLRWYHRNKKNPAANHSVGAG